MFIIHIWIQFHPSLIQFHPNYIQQNSKLQFQVTSYKLQLSNVHISIRVTNLFELLLQSYQEVTNLYKNIFPTIQNSPIKQPCCCPVHQPNIMLPTTHSPALFQPTKQPQKQSKNCQTKTVHQPTKQSTMLSRNCPKWLSANLHTQSKNQPCTAAQ